MSNRELYNQWSSTYDEVDNKTRDLERIACQSVLSGMNMDVVIELGCGTGKNTVWLADRARHLTAVDFSEQMMARAKEKLNQGNVIFRQADITKPWSFVQEKAVLITCSLVLEHVENLTTLFQQVACCLGENGRLYVCELHPFKQYSGSKARFDSGSGTQTLDCFTHHISDYLQAATVNNLSLLHLNEWFDDDDRSGPPRLISFLFGK